MLLELSNDSFGSGPRCLKKQATASSTPSVWGCSTRHYAPVDLSQGKLLNVNVNLRREDFQISQCQCQPTDVADWSIKRFTLEELHKIRSLQILPVLSQYLDVALVRLILLLNLFVSVILMIVFGGHLDKNVLFYHLYVPLFLFIFFLLIQGAHKAGRTIVCKSFGLGKSLLLKKVMLER